MFSRWKRRRSSAVCTTATRGRRPELDARLSQVDGGEVCPGRIAAFLRRPGALLDCTLLATSTGCTAFSGWTGVPVDTRSWTAPGAFQVATR